MLSLKKLTDSNAKFNENIRDDLEGYMGAVDSVKDGLTSFVKHLEHVDDNFNSIRALALKT